MLRIGEFSRLARVSVKALRYYDRLGLLRPARTDELTGYRYYSSEQLPRLNAILSLKELGLSLEQISGLLDSDLSRDQVRAMLELKRDEVKRDLEVQMDRLVRIEARLTMHLRGEVPGEYAVVLKEVEALRVASVRNTLPSYGAVGTLFGELFAFAASHDLKASELLGVWHDAEYREEVVDGEAAFVVESPLPQDGRVRERELPAATMACVVHHGSLDTIGGAFSALLAWIDGNDCKVSGPYRELYLRGGPEQDNPDYVTEIQFPVEKAQ